MRCGQGVNAHMSINPRRPRSPTAHATMPSDTAAAAQSNFALRTGDRLARDQAAGMLSFDNFNWTAVATRWTVLWLETRLDCRFWGYYCDLRAAMARLHDLRTPSMPLPPTGPDLIIVGPRMATNNYHVWDPLGINRTKWASVPLVVIQNKMYDCVRGESCGGGSVVKLEWARQAGAAAAFTWITRHHEFTQRSGVRHHWLPFAASPELYGKYADMTSTTQQPFDVGFSGTNDPTKYPLRAKMVDALESRARRVGWNTFIGSWSRTNQGNWSKLSRQDYVRRIAQTKIWLSTTGPDGIAGTRFFEVLASGTTMLLCNRHDADGNGVWIYSGLFQPGRHVQTFNSTAELADKVAYYLAHEEERMRIVRAARALAKRLHSWDARARFISAVARRAMDTHPAGSAWYASPPPVLEATAGGAAHYKGCYAEPRRSLGVPASKAARSGGQPPAASPDVTVGADDDGWHEENQPRSGPFTGGFNVSDCQGRCVGRGWSHFALVCGGFCKGGDVHNRARCMCGSPAAWRSVQSSPMRKPAVCMSTCSLHDPRPCGAAGAMAVYGTDAPARG